jgi:hypothetical protein
LHKGRTSLFNHSYFFFCMALLLLLDVIYSFMIFLVFCNIFCVFAGQTYNSSKSLWTQIPLWFFSSWHFFSVACFLDLPSTLQKEDLDSVCSLLSSSSHGVLASLSGPDKLVDFLLMDLYSPYSRGISFYLLHRIELSFKHSRVHAVYFIMIDADAFSWTCRRAVYHCIKKKIVADVI